MARLRLSVSKVVKPVACRRLLVPKVHERSDALWRSDGVVLEAQWIDRVPARWILRGLE